jgi:protein TonB
MRNSDSLLSLAVHAAIVAAALRGTATARPKPSPAIGSDTIWALPYGTPDQTDTPLPVPGPAPLYDIRLPTMPPISLPTGASPTPGVDVLRSLHDATIQASGNGISWSPFDENYPEVLAAPIPAYPERLRQAGVEGRVVLEAVVDSSGRVDETSIRVVLASHPGFVRPARDALIGTLFRPARVGGRPVAALIHLPIEFRLTGR